MYHGLHNTETNQEEMLFEVSCQHFHRCYFYNGGLHCKCSVGTFLFQYRILPHNILLTHLWFTADVHFLFYLSQECSNRANSRRFSLRDLLMVPMQRVLKYHLLLQVCLYRCLFYVCVAALHPCMLIFLVYNWSVCACRSW